MAGGLLSMLSDVFASKFILVSELQGALSGVADRNLEISAEQAFLDAIMDLLQDDTFRYVPYASAYTHIHRV